MTPTNGNNEGGERGSPGNDQAAAIARRAYDKWLARGCPEGDELRDWYEAEQEILEAGGQPTGSSEPARRRKRAAP